MDKVMHFTVGMIIFIIANRFISFAVVPVIIAALCKEIYDLRFKRSYICIWDIMSTISGGLVAYLLIYMLGR